jgi:hypothetical protein
VGFQHLCQMQGHLLYELCARSHQAVELRAIRQGREGASEMARGVAVEIPLAAKPGPTGEDGEGYDLAFGKGRLGAGLPFWPMGVAEVVHHDVKCGKEGVLRSSIRIRFLSLRDRVASRL